MGFRFNRRIRILPGIRLNLGKGGVSTSIGKRGAWLTVGKRGTRVTVGLPGTGLSYTRSAQASASSPRLATTPLYAPARPRLPRGIVILGLLACAWLAFHWLS